MSKRIRLVGSFFGDDVTLLSVFATAVTSSANLITGSVPSSVLLNGIEFDLDDSINSVVVKCIDGQCLGQTSSIDTTYTRATRYFNVISDGQGQVEILSPTPDGPTTGSLSQTVDFNTSPTFTIEASEEGGYFYGVGFEGWYDKPSGSVDATLLYTGSTLTITKTTFTSTDDFYAYFSD